MNRIYHTWDKWECYPAGFYENKAPNGLDQKAAVNMYAELLKDTARFRTALDKVISTWKNSCEHYLSNECMNRIAWLGQAAACVETGIPAAFRGGFNLLSETEKEVANNTALEALNKWLKNNGEPEVNLSGAYSKKQVELY